MGRTGRPPEQAANLRTRAELMQQIAAIVKESKWTQVKAASHCGITQARAFRQPSHYTPARHHVEPRRVFRHRMAPL